jgi:hypothetical protein
MRVDGDRSPFKDRKHSCHITVHCRSIIIHVADRYRKSIKRWNFDILWNTDSQLKRFG